MSKILRRRELTDDDWVTLGETPPGDAESVIVPFAKSMSAFIVAPPTSLAAVFTFRPT